MNQVVLSMILLSSLFLTCCNFNTRINKEDEILMANIKESELSNLHFSHFYTLEKEYYIHSLNTDVVVYTQNGTTSKNAQITLYDRSTDNIYIGKMRGNYLSYVNGIPYDDFHPYYSYKHHFKFLENYLNDSPILKKRMITNQEMDSLVIYTTKYNHNTNRIDNLIELETVFETMEFFLNGDSYVEEQKVFIRDYLRNGKDFLSKRINSKTAFIYEYGKYGESIMIEINHGYVYPIEHLGKNDYLKYRLDVYEISPVGANIWRLLKDAGLREEE